MRIPGALYIQPPSQQTQVIDVALQSFNKNSASEHNADSHTQN